MRTPGAWAGGGAPVQRRIPEGKGQMKEREGKERDEENLHYICLLGPCALHLADEEMGLEMLEDRFG